MQNKQANKIKRLTEREIRQIVAGGEESLGAELKI